MKRLLMLLMGLAVVGLLALLIVMGMYPGQRIIHVDCRAVGANNGNEWKDAYVSLATALEKAGAGDEIWVKEGVYRVDNNGDSRLELKPGVSLFGGFAGDERTRAERLPMERKTYICGNRTPAGGPAVQIIPAPGAALDGFVILADCIPAPAGFRAAVTIKPLALSILYVKHDAGGLADGSSWTDAFTDLQQALAAAGPTDEIWVAKGTYRADVGAPGDRTKTFQLKTDVALYGGFSGTPGTEGVFGERNWETNITVLSGDLAGNDVGDADDASHAENTYHILTGVPGATVDGFVIRGGNADGDFPYNVGGGLYNKILNDPGPTVRNCTFDKNHAIINGAGVYNEESSPTIENCRFTGNVAENIGGGMYSTLSSGATLRRCWFENNRAGLGGAVYDNRSSATTAINCVFVRNTAPTGGALYINRSFSVFINCTISGNDANNGGGAGIVRGSTPTFTNCILWGNTAPSSAQLYQESDCVVTVANSCIDEDGFSGSGNIRLDPRFLNPAGKDLRLRADSPCIDAGASGAAVPATDYFGLTRDANPDMGAFEFARTVPGGLVAWWKFDEGSGTNAVEVVAGNDGTLTNGPTWEAGIHGGGISFDGVDDYLDAGNVTAGLTKPFSVAFWIRLGKGGTVVSSNTSATAHCGFWVELSDVELAMNLGDGTGTGEGSRRTKSGHLSPSNFVRPWNHITVVVRTETDMDLYFNGNDLGGTYSGTGGPMALSADPFRLCVSSAGGLMRCVLDDVRLYDRELSAAEAALLAKRPPVAVASLQTASPALGSPVTLTAELSYHPEGDRSIASYSWQQIEGPSVTLDVSDPVNPTFTPMVAGIYRFKLTVTDDQGVPSTDATSGKSNVASVFDTTHGLVAWWKMDDGSGTVATESISGNSGNLMNGVGWVSGFFDDAITLDGTDDYVDAGDILNGLSVPFTISAWVRLGTDSDMPVVASDDSSTHLGYWLQVSPGQVSMNLGDGAGSGSGNRRTKSSLTSIEVGKWANVIAVVRSATDMSLYLNGADIGGAYSGSGAAMASSSAPFRLGTRNGELFSGAIDDVRVFDRALNSADVASLANIPPVARATHRSSNPVLGEAITLSGEHSYHPNTLRCIVKYAWHQTHGPAVTLDLSDPIFPTFTPTVIGDYQFKLVVTDNHGLTSSDANSPGNRVSMGIWGDVALIYDGNQISDGDLSPRTADGTDFGNAAVGQNAVMHSFLIANMGSAPLVLTGDPVVSITGPNASDFTVTVNPVSPVAVDGTTTFTIEFDPGAAGLRTATVSIASDDPDENPYTFAIQGTGINNVSPVAMANASPNPADKDQTVTLSGAGSYDPDNAPLTPLTYSWEQLDNGFPSVTITDEDQQDATFSASQDGIYAFRLTVSDGGATDTADVEVLVGDVLIVELQPSVLESAGTIQGTVRTTRAVTGAPLVVALTSSDTEEATAETPITIGVGNASQTFDLTINNDDILEANVVVTIKATATDWVTNSADITIVDHEAADIGLEWDSVDIAPGDTTPSTADGTDFGSVKYSGLDAVSHTFTIRNDGSLDLHLDTVTPIQIVGSGDFTVTVPPAGTTLVPDGSTTFIIKFDPTVKGLQTATVRIFSDDEDEAPFEFTIQGTGKSSGIYIGGGGGGGGCVMSRQGSTIPLGWYLPLLLAVSVMAFVRRLVQGGRHPSSPPSLEV